MSGTLILIRHGEIIRPTNNSNFDSAPLSSRGKEQIAQLADAWPTDPPTAIFESPLRRSRESAAALAEAFPWAAVTERSCLEEWSPDESGISQAEYKALERICWSDFDHVPPSGESLAAASLRSRGCLEEIARGMEGSTVAIVGHGTLFSLVTADLKGELPTEAYKDSIGFGHAAILESGSSLRLVRDFQRYGTVSQ